MFRYVFVLFILILLFISVINYSNIDFVLDKGDKLVYEVKYCVGNNIYTDYFEININDKYVADKTYFDIYIRYYNSSSGITIAKEYRSTSAWDMSRYLSIADKSGGEITGILYITIPIVNWNNRVSDDEPIGAKVLSLKINSTRERSLDIGGSRISILATVLEGVVEGVSYEAIVDYYSGILITLKAICRDTELFSIKLTYFTDYVAVLKNNFETITEVKNNKSLNQVIPIVMLAAISIIVLMAIVSYLSRF